MKRNHQKVVRIKRGDQVNGWYAAQERLALIKKIREVNEDIKGISQGAFDTFSIAPDQYKSVHDHLKDAQKSMAAAATNINPEQL